ncbi:hypothetical protein [Pseudanabaena sp. PCC 6802]|uniref:hypothetical protein n=1 Tax=Pseudanabaena sp. PCC 6802 TaxID=118173 RepID=UPI00034B4266|nr:hypothetical protein [Pseudanabaena sp. PCC 6802]
MYRVGAIAMAVGAYKWTTDSYHQAIEAGVFDDRPVELLKGEIVLMASEGVSHQNHFD